MQESQGKLQQPIIHLNFMEGLKKEAKANGVRILSYVTNHIICHIPSHTIRNTWYTRVIGVTMGKDSSIQLGVTILFYGISKKRNGMLTIGNNTAINANCWLDASAGLRIGNNVSISPHVFILTGQHDIDAPDFAEEHLPVEIEDRVFIGTRAMILPGVKIGEGSVVVAGAVVMKSIPPYTIVGGVPARKIGERSQNLTYNIGYEPFLG